MLKFQIIQTKSGEKKNWVTITGDATIENIVQTIRTNEKAKAICEKIQAEPDEAKQKKMKENLPMICFNGYFDGYRDIKSLRVPTGFSILDFDNLKDPVDEVFARVVASSHIKYVRLMFRSPRRNGLKLLVWSNFKDLLEEADSKVVINTKHHSMYDELCAIFAPMMGEVKVDEGAKDISRNCYMSYDPDIYYNENSEQYIMPPANMVKVQKQVISYNNVTATGSGGEAATWLKEMIEFLDSNQMDITIEYQDWLAMGFLIKKILGNSTNAFKYWHMLSQHNPKYEVNECRKKLENIMSQNNDTSLTKLAIATNLLKKYKINFKSNDCKKDPTNFKDEKYHLGDLFGLLRQDGVKIVRDTLTGSHLMTVPNYLGGQPFLFEGDGDRNINGLLNHILLMYDLDLTKTQLNQIINSPNDLEIEADFIRKYFDEELLYTKDDEWNKFKKNIIFEDDCNINIFKRWMLGAMDNLFSDDKFYDILIMIDDKGGNVGKSKFIKNHLSKPFRNIYGLKKHYFDMGQYMFDATKKNFNERKQEYQSVISYKEEINAQHFKSHDNVRSYLSGDDITGNVKYEVNAGFAQRCVTFIGCSNNQHMLPNDPNVRRYNMAPVKKLNFDKVEVDFRKVWGYIYHLWLTGVRYRDISVDSEYKDEYISKNQDDITLSKIIVPISEGRPLYIDEIIRQITALQMEGRVGLKQQLDTQKIKDILKQLKIARSETNKRYTDDNGKIKMNKAFYMCRIADSYLPIVYPEKPLDKKELPQVLKQIEIGKIDIPEHIEGWDNFFNETEK